eukprot:s281_g2.t1
MLDGDEDLGRDCKYFFGALSQDGSLGSWGTLFSGSAMKDDAEFRECFDSDQFYDEIADGSGRDNLPDGFGLQHFQGAREGNKDDGFHGGTYTGEFKNGKRHGRGTWKALEGDWEFRPISTETSIQNFENDVMHGIGIVEDAQHVHENVIYTKGKCQMPFTELGPPKTGFESAALNDMMPQASRRRAMVTPLPTIWDASTPKEQDPIWSLLKGFGRKLDCMSELAAPLNPKPLNRGILQRFASSCVRPLLESAPCQAGAVAVEIDETGGAEAAAGTAGAAIGGALGGERMIEGPHAVLR